MRKKSFSLTEIRKSWWWRRGKFSRAHKITGAPGIPFVYSDDQSRRVALNYELMRRAPAGKQFSITFEHLDREQRTICFTLWSIRLNTASRPISYDAQKTEKGWFSFDPKIQWNLRINDNALKTAIMEQINLQRKLQKIRRVRHLNGQINRGMSWRYVELLDLSDYKLAVLNSGQRHMVSEARKKAKIYSKEYKRALKQWLKVGDDLGRELENEDSEVPGGV